MQVKDRMEQAKSRPPSSASLQKPFEQSNLLGKSLDHCAKQRSNKADALAVLSFMQTPRFPEVLCFLLFKFHLAIMSWLFSL